MSASSNGLQALQQLAAQFRYLTELATEFEGITSLETLATEANARMLTATVEADKAEAKASLLKDQIVALQAQADKIMADANIYVTISEQRAEVSASDIIYAAKANAEGINANAQTLAQKLVGDAGAKVTALEQQSAKLESDVEGMEAAIASLNIDYDTATAKLQLIRDSIAKLAAE